MGREWFDRMKVLIREKEERVEALSGIVKDGHVFFKNDKRQQEAILHRSSKRDGVMQFSFFDERGPVGDFEVDAADVEEIARKIDEYAFVPCEEGDFEYSILADAPEPVVARNVEKKREFAMER